MLFRSLDVAKQALTSYAINTGMQGISPGTAGSVSNTIGSALDLTPEQISSMKDTLTFKGAVPSVVGPLEQAVGVTPGSLADKAITGATKGAISAAIQGKDISEGAVSGLVSAGMKGVSGAAKSGLENVKGALSTPIGTSSGDTGAPEEETYKQPPLPYVTSVDEDGTKHYNDGTTVYPDNSVTRPANDFYGTPELRIDANGNYYTDGKLVSGPDFTEETGGLPSAQAKTDTTVDHLPAEQQVDVSGQKESGLDVLTPENKIVADTKGTLPPENQVVIPEKKLTEEETYPLDTVTTPKKETVTVDPYAKTPEQVVIPEKKLTEEETFPLDTVTTPKKETVTVDPYAKTPEQVVIPEKKLTDDTGDIDAGTITITAPKETVEIDPYKKTPDQIVVTGPKEPPELQQIGRAHV